MIFFFNSASANYTNLAYKYSFESITGLRFSNKWLYLSYGKGAQGWGTNYDITLGVNQDSEPYDYGSLGLDFGYLKVNYFHGFLENDTIRLRAQLFSDDGKKSFSYEELGNKIDYIKIGKNVGKKILKLAGTSFKI